MDVPFPQWPTHFGPLIGYCRRQMIQQMDRRLREFDISPIQSHVLIYLCRAQEQVNQKHLEQFLMVKPSTVNGIVCRLEEKGLVQRTTSDTDARCRVLTPTEQGRQYADRFSDILHQVSRQMEKGFTPEELATMQSYLLRMVKNLEEEEENNL